MPFDIDLERADLEGLPETVAITDLYEETDDGKFRFVPKINGVKPVGEFDRVNEALRKERLDHKAVKSKYSSLGERDVDEMLAQLDEVEELRAKLEHAGDIPEDKIEEMVEKRLARIKAPLDRDLAKVTAERDERDTLLAATRKELNDLYIGQHLTELAAKHCDPAVQRDVVEIGRYYLTRDEEGDIVTKDESPLPASEWIKNQLEERPHWNKPTGNGGGGKGNQSGKAGAKNPFSAENVNWAGQRPSWNPGALAAQDAYLRDHGREAYDAAARAAGVDRPGSFPPRPVPNGRAAV